MTDRLVFEREGDRLTLNWYYRDAAGHIFMAGPQEVSGFEAVEKLVLFLRPVPGVTPAPEARGGGNGVTPPGG